MRALPTPVFVSLSGVAPLAQHDSGLALAAFRWLVFWRILQFLEVVLVRSIRDIHLHLNVFSTLWTLFPMARVFFGMVVAAQGEPPVIPVATVPSIREQHVLIFVVADPVAATLCLGQFPFLTTKPTPRPGGPLGAGALLSLLHIFPFCRTYKDQRWTRSVAECPSVVSDGSALIMQFHPVDRNCIPPLWRFVWRDSGQRDSCYHVSRHCGVLFGGMCQCQTSRLGYFITCSTSGSQLPHQSEIREALKMV